MRKILDAIAIISFLLSGTVVGLIGYAYLTLTNEKKQEEIKEYIMDQAKDLIQDQIGGFMPDVPSVTGGVEVPTAPMPTVPKPLF